LVCCVLILVNSWGWAQQGLTYADVERLTYQAFIDGQYDKVKKIGQEALAQNFDYFDLRLRLGIVYFREQHFDNALLHFEKAHQMNPQDAVLQEFLYFTYINLGKW
ncbi:tetratricopeptide repeat protein, partial [Arthrospira platensis SPKY2]